MIDTVNIGFNIAPTGGQLEQWYSMKKSTPFPMSRHWDKYSLHIPTKNGKINVVYYPQDINGRKQDRYLIECSLPQICYGDNNKELESINDALDYINQILMTYPFLPCVDLRRGCLHRLDLFHNYQVGDLVHDYICYLQKQRIPHRKTKPYEFDGVQFRAQPTSSKFYNKYNQSKDPSTYGILRQEITYRGCTRIGKLLKIDFPTMTDINFNVCREALEDELKILGLDKCIISERITAHQQILKCNSGSKALRLIGFYELSQQLPREQLMSTMKLSSRQLNRYEAQIKNTGISLIASPRNETLPCLRIG